MIELNEIMDAFGRVAPEVMAGDIDQLLKDRAVNPEAVATVGTLLTSMYVREATPPEEAVPATFTIGIIIGMGMAEDRQS